MSARDDPRTRETMRWFGQFVQAAERIAKGLETCPVPRQVPAFRIRKFVAMCDREQTWDLGTGEIGDRSLRARALAVAEVLDDQARRARMPA